MWENPSNTTVSEGRKGAGHGSRHPYLNTPEQISTLQPLEGPMPEQTDSSWRSSRPRRGFTPDQQKNVRKQQQQRRNLHVPVLSRVRKTVRGGGNEGGSLSLGVLSLSSFYTILIWNNLILPKSSLFYLFCNWKWCPHLYLDPWAFSSFLPLSCWGSRPRKWLAAWQLAKFNPPHIMLHFCGKLKMCTNSLYMRCTGWTFIM